MVTTNAYSVAMAVMDRQLQGEVGEERPYVDAMQLQKLVYYCQAYHAAWFKDPMFPEQIEAWTHGPVVRDLWELHRRQIAVTKENLEQAAAREGIVEKPLSAQQNMVVDSVCKALGGLTGWQLRNRTHDETPWRNHYDASSSRHEEVIPPEELGSYYRNQ